MTTPHNNETLENLDYNIELINNAKATLDGFLLGNRSSFFKIERNSLADMSKSYGRIVEYFKSLRPIIEGLSRAKTVKKSRAEFLTEAVQAIENLEDWCHLNEAMHSGHGEMTVPERATIWTKQAQASKAALFSEPSNAERLAIETMWYELDHFWRWIERAHFDKTLGVKMCLNVLVHSPAAPWNVDREAWDTRHKSYDADIDRVVESSQARQNAIDFLEMQRPKEPNEFAPVALQWYQAEELISLLKQ